MTALISQSADPKLESFFDQWVYSSGVPNLQLKYSLAGKAPALKLTVRVEQSGVDEDFSASVPVEIQFAARDSVDVEQIIDQARLDLNVATNHLQFLLHVGPHAVVVFQHRHRCQDRR